MRRRNRLPLPGHGNRLICCMCSEEHVPMSITSEIKEDCKRDYPHALQALCSGRRISFRIEPSADRRTTTEEKFAVGKLHGIGSPSGGVNFFNAICRLLMYEGSFSTRFSDLLISADLFVRAESVFYRSWICLFGVHKSSSAHKRNGFGIPFTSGKRWLAERSHTQSA
jgi:hypothetical protein